PSIQSVAGERHRAGKPPAGGRAYQGGGNPDSTGPPERTGITHPQGEAMRRSLRTVLTLAAASAATAVVVGTPAAADPQPLILNPPVQTWDSYYSSNFNAKARGTVKT